MWGNIAIAFLLAFIVSFMATPYTIKIANKIGAVDVPKDKRRMHTKRMPKFGGPAVILGFIVSMIYLIIMENIILLMKMAQKQVQLIIQRFASQRCIGRPGQIHIRLLRHLILLISYGVSHLQTVRKQIPAQIPPSLHMHSVRLH